MSDGREERQEQEQRREWDEQKDRESYDERNPVNADRPERRES